MTIEQALATIPKFVTDWEVAWRHDQDGYSCSLSWDHDDIYTSITGHGATPAEAILAAALKASSRL